MYKDASIKKRVLSAVVDYLIIFVLGIIISVVVSYCFKDKLVTPEALIRFLEINPTPTIDEFIELMNNSNETRAFVINFYLVSFLDLGLTLLSLALYFIVLPSIWKKGQTVGRYATGIKMVRTDGGVVNVGTYILREIVGKGLMSLLNFCCGVVLIVDLAFIFSKGRIIADYIADTKFVDLNQKIETYEFVGGDLS